jgi:(2R)-sulfolactate sulfo-lyase subunit alpha
MRVNRRAFLRTTGASVLATGAAAAVTRAERPDPQVPRPGTASSAPPSQPKTVGQRVDFIVPEPGDLVGVIVAERIEAGQELQGWILDTDATPRLRALESVPFGHKIALQDFAKEAAIVEYGLEVGQATVAIRKGSHVHVHNMASKRWAK